jgi:hypothetical protein
MLQHLRELKPMASSFSHVFPHMQFLPTVYSLTSYTPNDILFQSTAIIFGGDMIIKLVKMLKLQLIRAKTFAENSSSGMLPRVALVGTDVSEECSATIIRVKRIGELGTTVAVASKDASCEEILRRSALPLGSLGIHGSTQWLRN